MRLRIVTLALIGIILPFSTGQAFIDSLIVSTVTVGPGLDTVLVPVYIVYETDICTAEINLAWVSSDSNINAVDIIPAAESFWDFSGYVYQYSFELFANGSNLAPEHGGRVLAFYIRFALDNPVTQQVDIRRGYSFTPVFWNCDHTAGTFPHFIRGAINYFTSRPPGDANGSYDVNGLDVVYLLNYLKGIGPMPDPLLSGDVNGSCQVNGLDVIYLVNYLKGGPAPFEGDCQ
jgi:hypothetical protein